MLALNRPSQPRFPTSRAQMCSGRIAASPRAGRTSGRDFGRLSDCVINQPGKGVHERFSFTRLFSRISNFRAQATIAQRKLLPLAIRRS
jgi:hypothetical protein